MCNACEVDVVCEVQTEGEVYAERGEHGVGVRRTQRTGGHRGGSGREAAAEHDVCADCEVDAV